MNPIKIQLADCVQCGECVSACLYNAIYMDEYPVIDQGRCLLCKSCIEACPSGLISMEETAGHEEFSCSTEAQGIWVMAEFHKGAIAPVTYELLGAARRLSDAASEEVSVILIGDACRGYEESLIAAGADHIYIAESSYLADQLEEMVSDVLVGMVRQYHPNILLIGATHFGRGISARTASILHTGLTADCTQLEIDSSSQRLLQIRPAFGGNIMAHIKTPDHRPQMATVRYKIMNAPERSEEESGEIVNCSIAKERLGSHVDVLDIVLKEKEKFIENADVLVVAGRGVKKQEDLEMLQKLADLLGGQLACTRPMAESGWLPAKCQIGLSGRTVRPKLIITCGVSGAVQFTAGMNHSENIFAINKDEKAPIFKTAHYCLVGDLYEVIPQLIQKIEEKKGA